MRDITYKSVRAFMDGVPFKLANTEVRTMENGACYMTLHGNQIAMRDVFGDLHVTSAGWESNTIKERLNGIPNVSVIKKAGQWYLNGEKWEKSEEWTKVKIPCVVCDKPLIKGTCAECDKVVAGL